MNKKGYMWILVATAIILTTTIILYENNIQKNTDNFSEIITKDMSKLSMYEITLNKAAWDCNWEKEISEINNCISTLSQSIIKEQLNGICDQTDIITTKTTNPKQSIIKLNCQRNLNESNTNYTLDKNIIVKNKPDFLDKKLLLWLRMNGTPKDNSPNSNNPTYINATPTTGIEDLENTAYSFNGIDNNILIPTNFSLSNNSWTMATWVYIDAYPKKGAIIMVSANGLDGYGIGFGSDKFEVAGDNFLVLFENIPHYNQSGGNPGTGWKHISVTYNGSTSLKIYYDGSLNKTITSGSPIIPTANQTTIGGYGFGSNNRHFNGKIDEVMIFGQELTAADINAIYNYTKPI